MTSFFQMLLFPMVESIVGGPATVWPRVILDFLFARPTDRSLMASTTLAAFFFGNNVPCALALPLLELCMDLKNSDPFLQAVYDLYNAWANTATTTRVCLLRRAPRAPQMAQRTVRTAHGYRPRRRSHGARPTGFREASRQRRDADETVLRHGLLPCVLIV